MKIRVWREGIKKKQGEILLRLVEGGEAYVEMNAVDEEGTRVNSGTIWSMDEDGLKLWGGISSKIGLPLIGHGYIKARHE
jgi:hypothetical protein